MTATTTPQPPIPNAAERPRHKRHRLRWTIAGTAVHVVLIVGLVAVASKRSRSAGTVTSIDVAGSIPVVRPMRTTTLREPYRR